MTSIVEKIDAYEISSAGLVVADCRRDSASLQLELHSANANWTVVIEGSFSVRRGTDGDHHALMPGIADLVGEPVLLIRARKVDGELEVKLGHDWVVTVQPDEQYEAWQMYSSGGERLVAVPGDGIAVWGVAR